MTADPKYSQVKASGFAANSLSFPIPYLSLQRKIPDTKTKGMDGQLFLEALNGGLVPEIEAVPKAGINYKSKNAKEKRLER